MIASAAILAALALRSALDQVWGDDVPYGTFYLAVVASIWFTRTAPAILVVIASLILGDYFFTSPRHTLGFTSTSEWLNALFFLIVSSGVLVFANRERRSLKRERTLRTAFEDQAKQLRSEQNLLDALLKGTDVPLAYLDQNFTMLMVNPAYARNCGKALDALVGKSLFSIFGQAETESLFKNARNAGEAAYWHDRPIVFPDQPERGITYWDWSLTPFRGHSGSITGMVFSMVETTQRKLAEQALRTSEDKFRRIFETANEGIWVLDDEGRVTMVNSRMAEMLGYSPEELAGKLNHELVPQEDCDAVRRLFERRRAGNTEQVDFRFRHRAGHLVWTLMCARPIFEPGGKFAGALDMFTDITERKRAEIRLDLLAETSSQLLRSHEPQHVVNALCQKVMAYLDCQVFFNFLLDEEQGRLRLNTCAGVSEEQVRAIEWLDFGIAVCGCAARDGCRIVSEDIQHSTDTRTQLVRSMGVHAYACHPLKVQDRVLGTLSFGTRSRASFAEDELALMNAVADLVAIAMERKRAQSELQRINTELETRVQERTRSLQELTEQLNAFCYTVAHDLRSPLRTQLSFARMLLIDYGEKLGDTGKDWAARVVQAAERQSNIIQDLMAHINVSRADMPISPVELSSAVEQAMADLKLELEQKDALIECTSIDQQQVLANPSSLHLVILNLLTNAVKFVRPGCRPEVRLWTEEKKEFVRLWVQDNGIGIKQEDIGKLFGAFQRLNRSTDYPGTGLGLAIVKKAAERMGGRVGVDSEPGNGSRFWLELKLHSPARDICGK